MKFLRLTCSIAIVTTLFVASFADAAFSQRFIPKNRGLPGRREGSGTRGACLRSPNSQLGSLIALMPKTNDGATISESPTLAWYVAVTKPTTGVFVLLDDQQREVYSSELAIAAQPGILRVKLPSQLKLTESKLYRWKFAIICDADEPSGNVMTEGWMQRIALSKDAQQRLKTASPLEKAAFYAQEGIWYDAASTLLELRQTQPNDVKTAENWKLLLESVNLNAIAKSPILP